MTTLGSPPDRLSRYRSASATGIGSQLTAENRWIEVGGDTLVYRRFSNTQTNAAPLLCLQHFRGNLDFWDPALVDRIAQELALLRPWLVRRLVLAGTGPQGGPDLHRWTDDVYANACAEEMTAETTLNIFFSGSQDSRAKGMDYLERTQRRQVDRDAPTDLATRDAQLAAITAWGIPVEAQPPGRDHPTHLRGRRRQRHHDAHQNMMHTKNSQLLAERLPNAHLRIYPDANHGFLNQYPELFADHVKAFLNAW
jgi:pimeloyl-ACP methyl ester carboxylesterase